MKPGLLVNRVLARVGFQLTRIRPARTTLRPVLEQLRRGGVHPATVIDGGAAFGAWTAVCREVWPDARYIAVEPLAEMAPYLAGTEHERAVLGRERGTATLFVHTDLSASSMLREHEEALAQEPREVPCTTIDELVAERRADGPFLIKLDVQGAELDALVGAERTLAATQTVLLEATLLEVFVGGPLLAEVIAFMRERGFVVYDAFDLRYRPLDGALVQLDVAFVPEDAPLRRERGYATPEQRARLDADFLQRLVR